MGEAPTGIHSGTFAAWIGAILAIVLLQSAAHLSVVLGSERVGTLVDLDRSNGIPDLASTVALAAAGSGAALIARNERGARRIASAALTAALAVLTLADLIHDGPHPSSGVGWSVIAAVVGAGVLLTLVGAGCDAHVRTTLLVAGCMLGASFLVAGLDEYDQWFERERGDPIAEYQVVAKEGLELLGWSLVALALWDEALRRRREAARIPTEPASRARAASRRRAA
jgi:hypothetical protein